MIRLRVVLHLSCLVFAQLPRCVVWCPGFWKVLSHYYFKDFFCSIFLLVLQLPVGYIFWNEPSFWKFCSVFSFCISAWKFLLLYLQLHLFFPKPCGVRLLMGSWEAFFISITVTSISSVFFWFSELPFLWASVPSPLNALTYQSAKLPARDSPMCHTWLILVLSLQMGSCLWRAL